jgi:transposase
MQIRSVGVDLGRRRFTLLLWERQARWLVKKKFSRKQLLAFTANMHTSLIGLEAARERIFSVESCGSKAMTCG